MSDPEHSVKVNKVLKTLAAYVTYFRIPKEHITYYIYDRTYFIIIN
jgi:hypothetical protein